MNRLFASFLCSGAVALAGCATDTTSLPPAPTSFPRTPQPIMQAAHHWDVLADYEAARILESVKDKSKPLYVADAGKDASSFETAYHQMLHKNLVAKGAVVVTKPMFGGAVVSYSVQVLGHQDRDYVAPTPGATYTILDDQSVHVDAGDVLSGDYSNAGPTEVIITTEVVEGHLVLMSDTDIFYFNAGDTNHYLDQAARGMVFQVVDQ